MTKIRINSIDPQFLYNLLKGEVDFAAGPEIMSGDLSSAPELGSGSSGGRGGFGGGGFGSGGFGSGGFGGGGFGGGGFGGGR